MRISVQHGRSFPTIKNGFRIRWTVDQRDFVEYKAGDRFWIPGLALCDTAADGKTSIDLIFDLGHSDWVDDMGDDSGRPVIADFGLESGSGGPRVDASRAEQGNACIPGSPHEWHRPARFLPDRLRPRMSRFRARARSRHSEARPFGLHHKVALFKSQSDLGIRLYWRPAERRSYRTDCAKDIRGAGIVGH